jgi:hypothetical protein
VALIAEAHCMNNLNHLDLSWNELISAVGAESIAKGTSLTNITSLNLWYTDIGNVGLGLILNGVSMSNLINLDVRESKINAPGWKLLEKAKQGRIDANNLRKIEFSKGMVDRPNAESKLLIFSKKGGARDISEKIFEYIGKGTFKYTLF